MSVPHRIAALTIGAATLAGLTACSGSDHTQSTHFNYSGATLHVTNPNDNMPVTVRTGKGDSLDVSVTTTTAAGKTPNTPAWTLTGDTLDLGSPCTKGYVGLCEGAYTLTVPAGTRVTVNGTATPAT